MASWDPGSFCYPMVEPFLWYLFRYPSEWLSQRIVSEQRLYLEWKVIVYLSACRYAQHL